MVDNKPTNHLPSMPSLRRLDPNTGSSAEKLLDIDADDKSPHHTLGIGTHQAIPAKLLQNLAPIGELVRFATGTPIPKGFISANGALLATKDYPQLFKVIGYANGGAGANFMLPNVAGYYVRYSWGQ